MRESLFEQLKRKEISFIDEVKKITNLINKSYLKYTECYFDNAFKCSIFNVYYEDFDVAMRELFEVDNDYFSYNGNIYELLNRANYSRLNLTLNCFLNYLEFFKTLFIHKDKFYDTNANQIKLIIDNDCDRIGYKFICEDDCYKVMLKDTEAEAVATKVNESTRTKIYKYLMIRNGCVEDKRNCIKALADDVELICKKYSKVTEYDKLKQFIQCIRHTKDDPKKEFQFYYKNEEQWLDKTFEMIIGILSFTRTKEIVNEIIKLENNYQDDK